MDTEVLAILDMSGSMHDLTQDTIGGFNTWLEETAKGQQQGDDVRITVVTFDTVVERHVERVPIKACPKLGTEGNPYVPRGGTALRDATGQSLQKLREFVPEGKRAFVLVITDGEENSSHEWTQDALQKLMGELEAEQRWSFLYMGAGIDAWANAQSTGDMSGLATRSTSYGRDAHGLAMASAGVSTQSYMASTGSVANDLGQQTMANMKDAAAKAEDEDEAKKTPSH